MRVDVAQAVGGGLGLRPAHGRAAEEHLAVEVALVDDVEIDQAERAHPGGSEVERGRRAQAPCAHQEHARGFQLALPLDPHIGQDQVARIPQDLLVRQFG